VFGCGAFFVAIFLLCVDNIFSANVGNVLKVCIFA
jgi:hypothetical protein